MKPPVEELGTAPSLKDVDDWMVESQGLIRHVVGKSFLGKDLLVYEQRLSRTPQNRDPIRGGATAINNPASVLFLSLVHGNEPAGLLTLLSTVSKLSSSSASNNNNDTFNATSTTSTTVLYFPVVNADAYEVNLQVPGGGCRRTNLNIYPHCALPTNSVALPCPDLSFNGVDINRNFPVGWNSDGVSSSQQCTYNHGGQTPWSEPETRAVRQVVEQFQPTHALSFHSRRNQYSVPPLLIHPYSSPHLQLNPERRQRYRQWTWELRESAGLDYRTGTAMETIHYSATGSTMDYLEQAHGIYTLVAEVVPTTSSRWCEPDSLLLCWQQAHKYADTAVQWVRIAERGASTRSFATNAEEDMHGTTTTALLLTCCAVVVLMAILLGRSRRGVHYSHQLLFVPLRTALGWGKEKDIGADTELAILTSGASP